MLHESLTSIFFRLLNFGIIIGLAYYLYKRYFKHRIDDKMTQKETLLKALEEQGYFLEGKAHDLELRLKEQEIKGQKLSEKMEEWRVAVLAEQVHGQEGFRIWANQAGQRVEHKNQVIARREWQEKILPQALNHARAELIRKFSDSSAPQRYVHEIVTHLEKE